MAVTKNDNYYKNEELLKLGSRVKTPNGLVGTVCNITNYKDERYDYKTASVRFDDRNIRSKVYSIGSLCVLDAHKRALFEVLTNEPCIVDLADFAIDFVVKFRNEAIRGYSCGEALRRYFLDEESIDSIAEVTSISKDRVNSMIKNVIHMAKNNEGYLNGISLLNVNANAPLGLILRDFTAYFLKTRGVYTIRDLLSISRLDLYRCNSRMKSEIGGVLDYLNTREVV